MPEADVPTRCGVSMGVRAGWTSPERRVGIPPQWGSPPLPGACILGGSFRHLRLSIPDIQGSHSWRPVGAGVFEYALTSKTSSVILSPQSAREADPPISFEVSRDERRTSLLVLHFGQSSGGTSLFLPAICSLGSDCWRLQNLQLASSPLITRAGCQHPPSFQTKASSHSLKMVSSLSSTDIPVTRRG